MGAAEAGEEAAVAAVGVVATGGTVTAATGGIGDMGGGDRGGDAPGLGASGTTQFQHGRSTCRPGTRSAECARKAASTQETEDGDASTRGTASTIANSHLIALGAVIRK